MARVWQLRVRVAKLIEKWVHHGIDGGQALGRRVLKQSRDKVDRVGIRLTEYLAERMRLDLRELVLHVVRVHCPDLVARWRSKDLDDFNKLVNTRFSGEQWLAKHQLCHNTTSRPYIYKLSVSSYQLDCKANPPIFVV